MCPSQTQDPLTDQDKYITRLDQDKLRLTLEVTCLGSLRLDQDKLRIVLEVIGFLSSTMLDGMDRPSWLDLSDGQINSVKSSGFLTCMVNHAKCSSDGLDT